MLEPLVSGTGPLGAMTTLVELASWARSFPLSTRSFAVFAPVAATVSPVMSSAPTAGANPCTANSAISLRACSRSRPSKDRPPLESGLDEALSNRETHELGSLVEAELPHQVQ